MLVQVYHMGEQGTFNLSAPHSGTDTLDHKATINDTAAKLCVNRLPLDKTPVSMDGVILQACAQEGRLYVEAADSAIGSITYFSASSSGRIVTGLRGIIIDDFVSKLQL